jgi:cyanate permease
VVPYQRGRVRRVREDEVSQSLGVRTTVDQGTRWSGIWGVISAVATQSVGYIFSGLGPLLVGILHEATGGWSVPLLMIAGSAVFLLLGGLAIARPGYVDDDLVLQH